MEAAEGIPATNDSGDQGLATQSDGGIIEDAEQQNEIGPASVDKSAAGLEEAHQGAPQGEDKDLQDVPQAESDGTLLPHPNAAHGNASGEESPNSSPTEQPGETLPVPMPRPKGLKASPIPAHSLTVRNVVPYFGSSDVEPGAHPAAPSTAELPRGPRRLSYSMTSPTNSRSINTHAHAPEPPPFDRRVSFEDADHWAHERRERELDRRARELDRRERELERRERELERRQREFEHDKARWAIEVRSAPQWHGALEALRVRVDAELAAERRRAVEREAALELNLMRRVNDALEKDRQMLGAMQMSDKEVHEMMEHSVGYLMQSDEDIADRVRFQSLLYLSQERLAMEAGLQPASGSGSLSLAWRLALGPSVVTEIRYNKALELLQDREDYKLDESTKKLMASKTAMEYVVEFTSHLRKEGSEMGDHSFAPGRIPREAYLESVKRQASKGSVDLDALILLVDYICPV